MEMNTRLLIAPVLLLLASCACTSPPDYMRSAERVRIFLPDNSRSVPLSEQEAGTLLARFNGRLFTNGTRIGDEDLHGKRHVLSVAYPYAQSTMILQNAEHEVVDQLDMGPGETHIHIYSDGTVGYIRTMKTYEIYPMRDYVAEAIRLAETHGLPRASENDANNGVEPNDAGAP